MITPEQAEMCLEILKIQPSTNSTDEGTAFSGLRISAAKKLQSFIEEPSQNG